jgi:chromosome segregation ATPase
MITPEFLIWAAEPAKASGMSFERWLTLAGFFVSAILGMITLLKFLKERSEAKSVATSASLKAPAEKDVIIVTGAQSAVLMMEQAAKSAREEADRYKADLVAARAENEALREKLNRRDEQIDRLEDKLRKIEFELNQATQQLASLRDAK